MPETTVNTPNGKVTIQHPEGATDEQILRFAQQSVSADPIDAIERPRSAFNAFFSAQNPGLKAIGEVAASLGTGAAAVPASGAVGLANLPRGTDAAANATRSAQERLTFRPQSELGKNILERIGSVTQPIQEGVERGIETVAPRIPNALAQLNPVARPLVEAATDTGVFESPAFLAGAQAGIQTSPALLGFRQRARPLNTKQQIVREAQDQGYVVPPSTASSSRAVQAAENVAGTPPLLRRASVQNQANTNRLASQSLGLDPDTVLTREFLQRYRAERGQAYAVLDNAGDIALDSKFRQKIGSSTQAINRASKDIPSLAKNEAGITEMLDLARDLKNKTAISGASADAAIRIIRDRADVQFNAGNRSLGRTYRQMADALEESAERHLTRSGSPEVVQNFRQARQDIARSYTIQGALRNSDVDAHAIRGLLRRDKPLGPELELIGKFAEEFPGASRLIKDGARDLGITEIFGGLAGTGGGIATGSPLLTAAGVLAASRPLIRQALLTRGGQALARDSAVTNPLAAQGIIGATALANDGT